MEVRKNIYYDIYYNEKDKKDIKKAKRFRQKLINRGFTLEHTHGMDGDIKDEQLIATYILKIS
jgi:hypothetical protein